MARWERQVDLEQYAGQFKKAGFDRMMNVANYLAWQLDANIIRSYKNRRPVYKSGKDAGKIYTARDMDILAKTIRVVTRPGEFNIWVMIGNYKTWWATQMERGKGDWKGGARPFFKKSVENTVAKTQMILDNLGGYDPEGRMD